MRIIHFAPAAALALAVLAGCVPTPPPVTLPPTPVETPLFASEEEALAAAVEVFGEYLASVDEMATGGWADSSISAPFTTDSFQAEVVESTNQLSGLGYHQTGEKFFDSVSLQQYSEEGAGRAVVTLYLCIDISETRILDANGQDLSRPDRLERLPTVVAVVFARDVGRVDGEEPWDGPYFC